MTARLRVNVTEPQAVALHRLTEMLLHSDHPLVRRLVNEALGQSTRTDALNAASALQSAVLERALV